MSRISMFLMYIMCIFSLSSFAEDSTLVLQEDYMNAYYAYLDSVEQTLEFQYDEVIIKSGLAEISVPRGFKFLNGEDSEMILTDIWGNPPSQGEERSLGMLMPVEDAPFGESSYVINITYTEDGYVDDSDAKDIDYDDLLDEMKDDVKEGSKQRVQMGYEPVELIGWASEPYYDAESKKLHWAKELKFGDDEVNTLNYNIRILGRRGYLQLNVIGGVDVLPQVKKDINNILGSVNFNEGHRYADFDPSIDQVAAYGVGALIAGKLLVKAGIFAKLGILLAKFWKVIAIAAVGLFTAVRKFFGKGKKQEMPEVESPK